MKDRYGREIDYLRISITDRCNLRCVYCMPKDGIHQISHKEILTYDEIKRVCQCVTTLGIHKIKLTGGEPLTRKNCSELVAMVKALPGIEKVTLTTNGVLLKDQLKDLAEAGIDPVEGDFECAVKDGTLVLRSGTDTNVYEMMKSLDDDFRDLLKSAGVSLSGLFLLLKEELDHDE